MTYTCRPPVWNLFPTAPLEALHLMTTVTILMGLVRPFLHHPLPPPPLPHLQKHEKQLQLQGEQVIQVPKTGVPSVSKSLGESVKMYVPRPTPRDADSEDLA